MAGVLVDALLVVSRLLFGGVIAIMGLGHFLNTEQMTGYAEHKGLPAPRIGVLGSGAVLVAGGLGLIVGVFPLISALAIAGFLVIAAVTMHNYWAVGEDQRQSERTQFQKNLVMAAGALALGALSQHGWILSLGIGF